MPNIKSAKKRASLAKLYQARNQMTKSELRTSVKKFDAALTNEEVDTAAAYKNAVSKIDRAVKKGVIHKNTAARKKSAITLKLNAGK